MVRYRFPHVSAKLATKTILKFLKSVSMAVCVDWNVLTKRIT